MRVKDLKDVNGACLSDFVEKNENFDEIVIIELE